MTTISAKPLNHAAKIAIIVAKFNADITEQLLANALTTFAEHNISDQQLTIVHVPGAVELGFVANRLAKQKNYSAIICFGAVIKGETAHFDYVSKLATEACNNVMLTHDVPVIFGVLTTYTREQAIARINGEVLDMGKEAAEVALEMISISEQL
jgi:6,7-dimethyl-8-ribityllumazine synthase